MMRLKLNINKKKITIIENNNDDNNGNKKDDKINIYNYKINNYEEIMNFLLKKKQKFV